MSSRFKNIRFFAAAALLAVLAAFSLDALAQTMPALNSSLTAAGPDGSVVNMNPGAADWSMKILRDIFGDISSPSASQNMLGAAMMKFNACIVVLGAAMFIFITTVGTLKTAEDGQVFGKSWSTVFIPLRVIMGNMMLVPTSSGFSAVQLAFMWLVGQGVGMADLVWSSAVNTYANNGGIQLAAQSAENSVTRRAMVSILESNVCNAVMSQKYPGVNFGVTPITLGANGQAVTNVGSAGSDPWAAQQQRWVNPKNTAVATGYMVVWGPRDANNGSGIARDYCGSVKLPGYQKQTVNNEVYDLAIETVQKAQLNGVMAATQTLQPIAIQIATNISDKLANDQNVDPDAVQKAMEAAPAIIASATDSYVQSVGYVANAAVSTLTDPITKSMTQDAGSAGWIGAGTWMFTIARAQTEINKLVQWTPQAKPPADMGEMGYDRAMAALVEQAAAPSWRDIEKGGGDPSAKDDGSLGSIMSNYIPNIKNLSRLVGDDPTSPKHPLVQIKNGGDWLMGLAETGIAVTTGVSVFGGKIFGAAGGIAGKVIGGGAEIGGVAAALVLSLLIPLLLLGIGMSIVIPFQPMIIWIGGVMGWVIVVAEAMIALPIWAAAHLHPEGHDIAGKASAGYLMLLEAVLRPVLMVFGLILAVFISKPMLSLLAIFFSRTVDSVQADSTTGIVTSVVVIGFYVAMCHVIVRRSFQLITIIPGVFNYIGGAGGRHDETRNLDAGMEGAVRGAGARGEAAAGAMMRQGKEVADQRKKEKADLIKSQEEKQNGSSKD